MKNCVSISIEGIKVIEDAFKNLSEGNAIMPPIMRLDIEENNGEVDVKTAYIKGLDSFAIKMSPGFFDNPKIGLPSTGGLMVLLSSKTGTLEAVLLDKGYLTDIRTALAGAISVKYLAKKEINARNGIIFKQYPESPKKIKIGRKIDMWVVRDSLEIK